MTPIDYTANSGCATGTINKTGNAENDLANNGQLPQIRVLNGKKGHYKVTAKGSFTGYLVGGDSDAYGYFRISDGTNNGIINQARNGNSASTARTANTTIVVADFDLDAFSDKTFKMQGAASFAGSGVVTNIQVTTIGFEMTVEYSPTQSQIR